MLCFVLACYLIGTAVGIGYLRIAHPWARQSLGLLLALVFVGIDVALVSGVPDATSTQRGLVASLVAIPLGALNQICKVRLGTGATAMTGNLQGAVGMVVARVDTWYRGALGPSLGHDAMLTPLAPILFFLGAFAGIWIERAVDYSLTPLSPLFVLGLWASADVVDVPEQLLGRRRSSNQTKSAGTGRRFTLALDL